MPLCWQKEEFEISTDPARLDLDVLHEYLSGSYWAQSIPRAVIEKSVRNSLCFGVYKGGDQIGFARVITDYATFAYLADVFILEQWRERGLSTWMMECVMGHPDLQGLRRWALVTRDAHGLYRKFGFTALQSPGRWMEIFDPHIYSSRP